jgi:hypothetical protein
MKKVYPRITEGGEIMAEGDLTEFGETFANGLEYWAIGVGRGILISAVPVLLIAVGLSVIVMLMRFPLKIIGGFQ